MKTENVDVVRVDYKRKFKLGTRLYSPNGGIWKYGKVDFGIAGETTDGKKLRNIQYRWVPQNITATSSKTG